MTNTLDAGLRSSMVMADLDDDGDLDAEGVAMQELALQGGEEALAEGIVEATPAPRLRLGAGAGVSDRAHRGSHTRFTPPFTKGQGGVLAALVTVVDHSGGTSLTDGHFQGAQQQRGAQVAGHRPTDHSTAPGIDYPAIQSLAAGASSKWPAWSESGTMVQLDGRSSFVRYLRRLHEDWEMAMENILNGHIEITPGVRAGKPRLLGTRIAVDDIVLMHLRLGQSLEEIAGRYDLSLAAVYAAMAYYYDHREEVDQRIESDQAFAEAFRRNNPSPLREKLRALSLA